MKTLIKKTRIVDSKSNHNNQLVDVLIEDGIIKKIDVAINITADNIIERENLHLSPGFVDINANACDPGYEYKEDLQTLCKAALLGGYTQVAISPKTLPITENKANIEYILSKARNLPVQILPIGAATLQLEGKELSELYDMQQAGAVAFSNTKNSIMHSGVLMRLLMYLKQFNGRLLLYADDKNLSAEGYVHEGIVSTRLGLKSRPALAESLMISRDIQLAELASTFLHFSTVSTAQSLQLIQTAKNKKQSITCDVAIHHLLFTDEKLNDFNSVYKVLPPLRSEDHRKALIEGLKTGLIDAITSDHTPQNIELKNKEFDLASYGAIGVQTAFRASLTLLKQGCTLAQLVDAFTHGPRKILGLTEVIIKENTELNATLFNPSGETIFTEQEIVSKSKNSMFINEKLNGKIYGTLLKNQINLIDAHL